ncbi:MAG: hypothetical protein AUH85_06210 [Chloroflexi bacterium 13_1_40CM_4_68_4]|nr:MAG: hypothetical protein AUH85_06210 [Chloroflexi bacterium 13_1_40CM_4_68_4]
MATLTLRRSTFSSERALELAPLAIGLLGLALGWAGSAWDVSWHRLIGRDTFWTTPHLGIYAGTMLSGMAALVATATGMHGRPIRARELAIGPLHVERGMAIVGFGALAVIAAGPFDELWHRTFGRDVDMWSPPHVFAIYGGGILIYLGWTVAAATNVFGLSSRLRDALVIFFASGIVSTLIFGMNFYYMMGWSREALFYPLLVCATVPFALAFTTELQQERFAATLTALAYAAFALLTFVALRTLGWLPPAFPPLVVAGAVAMDILRARTRNAWALGAAFAVAFVVFEGARLLTFTPAPPSAGSLADPQFRGLVLTYYFAAEARPWLSAWPIAAALLGAPLAAASLTLGRVAARVLDVNPAAVPPR